MTTEYIDDDHRLMRHVPWARVRKDNAGKAIGFNPQAFKMRDVDDYLSASWVEYFSASADPVAAAAAHFANIRSVKPKDRFAVGVVQVVKEACASFGAKVRVTREGRTGFESHAGVRQFPRGKDELLELLAAEAWSDCYPPL